MGITLYDSSANISKLEQMEWAWITKPKEKLRAYCPNIYCGAKASVNLDALKRS